MIRMPMFFFTIDWLTFVKSFKIYLFFISFHLSIAYEWKIKMATTTARVVVAVVDVDVMLLTIICGIPTKIYRQRIETGIEFLIVFLFIFLWFNFFSSKPQKQQKPPKKRTSRWFFFLNSRVCVFQITHYLYPG